MFYVLEHLMRVGYKMAEYSRLAKGSFTSTGAAKAVYLPFQPSQVKLYNYSAAFAAPAANAVISAYWDVSMGQGFALETGVYNATPVLVADAVVANGISTFSAGLALQYGAQLQIAGITKAAAGVVTTAAAHGYSSGDIVLFQGLYQSATTGMPQISDIPFVITVTGATTFSFPWNTNQSAYTALSGSPTGAFVKKVLYPFLYSPEVSFITAVSTGSTTVVSTTAPHNLVLGQSVAFRIPSAWGITQLNSLPNILIPGQPVYGFVSVVNSSTQVTVAINSSAYTAYTSNVAVASVPGLTPPQMLAVGDVNTGGVAYSGSVLYPSPVVNGVSTINGPAISGAFVNNTRQGFVVGVGAGTNLASSALVGANGNVIYWEAALSDI